MSRRWRRVAAYVNTVTLTLAIGAFAPPQPALAAPAVDQQQLTIDTTVGGLAIGGSSTQKLAQTVTSGAAGDLVQVDLPAACTTNADLNIAIHNVAADGSPGTVVLASTTITGSTIPAFYPSPVTFRSFTFTSPATLSVGQQFAIVLTSTATSTTENCATFQGPVGDSYTGGDDYFDALPNAPGWLHNCGEFPSARCDLPFRTWVEPPPAPTGADLSITKTLVNPSNLNVFAGTDQTYQLTVANAGPSLATGVTLVDTLPANVTLVQAHPACVNAAGTLTCTLGPGLANLAAGSSFSIFIQVKFNNAGSYTNTASVSANEADPNASNNTSSHTQQVLPTADLIITQIFVPGTADPGQTVVYDSYLENQGPDAAGKVVLLQKIPSGSTFVSISSPDTTICGQGTNADEYGCQFASIPVNGTRSMTVTITVPTTPQKLTNTFAATHVMPPLIYDPPAGSSLTFPTWVVDESNQQAVGAGGIATTDTENDGATADDPVETTVQPSTAGTVSISEEAQNGPAGATQWTFLGIEVVISAPAGTAAAPLALIFRIDSSFLFGLAPGQVDVWRNYGTTPVPDCQQPVYPATPSTSTPISPDPCVWNRTTLSDGDLEIIVFSSQASVWAFAVHDAFEFGGFELPMDSPRKAGAVLPVKFRLSSGGEAVADPGLDVLVAGSPDSRAVSCENGAALGTWGPMTIIGRGLHFDPETNVYSVNWKTDKSWSGTCRELRLALIDGSEHTAIVEFR